MSDTAAEPIPRRWRYAFRWNSHTRAVALWCPWRHANRPLLYWWFVKDAGCWRRAA